MTFRLKTLFIAVTVAAILLAIFFALPLEISVLVCGMISVIAPAGFVSWIVYGRGYGRAFAIGCTAASAIMLFSMGLEALLLIQSIQTLAVAAGTVGDWSPFGAISRDDADNAGVFAILFTPFPLGYSLVLLSGGLSVLVRWLTLRERCPLE
jgi:hypothetical protein